MNPSYTIVVAVIEENGAVFLVKRPAGTHLQGYWEFPGGKIEAGETLERALFREVREEVGWEILVLEKIDEVDYSYTDRDVHLHFYRCVRRTQEEPATPLEPLEYVWAPIQKLSHYNIPPANQKVVQNLIERET
ncbi:MAG: 8-oxo-dGTP diphosphatase MutT [Deltaproteobacteria bacterium]|nr:8-oxo-dGTP diphosphatase MutT [Deltaproteobacteria bacterium]